jgi:protein-disulfide isomerase
MRSLSPILALVLSITAFAWASPMPHALADAAGAGEPPRVQVPIDGSPTLGPDTAAVTIVEFSDFLCRHSAQGTLGLQKLVELYPSDVRLVFKHFPLGPDVKARAAHQAAVAAGRQDKFWEMHDRLFANQRWGRRSVLIGFARDMGLDVDAFYEASRADESRERVLRDVTLGRRLEVTATPTYFVNGLRVVGAQPPLEWRKLIQRELKAVSRTSPRS